MVQFLGKNGILSKISRSISKSTKDAVGGENEASFSLLTSDMVTPLDKPISTMRAVQVYKKYMLNVGYLEKSDISDFVRSLKEDMAEREEDLKFEIKNAKEHVAEAKAEVKNLKKRLSKCKDDDDREYVREELDTATAELGEEMSSYEKFAAELILFKKDKREFLVNYINSEIHGDGWQESSTQIG
jgi:uncharacterized membrane-anchored protein YjiN (DUF445 family)